MLLGKGNEEQLVVLLFVLVLLLGPVFFSLLKVGLLLVLFLLL